MRAIAILILVALLTWSAAAQNSPLSPEETQIIEKARELALEQHREPAEFYLHRDNPSVRLTFFDFDRPPAPPAKNRTGQTTTTTFQTPIVGVPVLPQSDS
jgi:hypothetical protein